MLPYDHEPLRLRLAADFAHLTNGNEDAAEVSEILATLTQTTRTMLCELAHAWSRSNDSIWLLPDEVLALCICFLPFEDRIAASHVSRRWRTTALSYPAIWADLNIPVDRFSDQNRIVRMALSRTGTHPVDMRGLSVPDPTGIIPQCLLGHMHHLRVIWWDLPRKALLLGGDAPVLETVISFDSELDIPADLNGGRPGRLQTLHIRSATFPVTCPALATLCSLTLCAPTNAAAATFGRIFGLCPNIQSLHLTGLMEMYSHSLTHGPAPRSLHTLKLKTSDTDYDLSGHFTDSLLEVSLEQETASIAHLEQLLDGALVLSLSRNCLFKASITAHAPFGRGRRVTFRDELEETALTADMLLAVQSNLRRVSAVQLPIGLLGDMLRVLAVLPMLRRVIVSIEPDVEGDGEEEDETHHFTWDDFDDLSLVGDYCPRLKEITLNVFCYSDCSLSADDARDVLACIASLETGTLPDIHITGFSQDSVLGLEMPDLDGVRVSFAVTGEET